MNNYPWSGRLGRVAKQCICCGSMGPEFQLSSHSTHCLQCLPNQEPDPQLLLKYQARYEKLARKWCKENNLDYDKIMENSA